MPLRALGSANAKAACQAISEIDTSKFSYKNVLHSFMCLQFGFVNFWHKEIGAKAAENAGEMCSVQNQDKSLLVPKHSRHQINLNVSYLSG